LVQKDKLSTLRRLHGMLENKDIEDREQFSDLMNAAFNSCGLEYTKLSDDLGYSRSAVYRWTEGDSAPHKSLWPKIVTWIMDSIEIKIEEIESSLFSENAILN
jgi:predicted DNA-binding transcriptional regulator AlpA